MIRAIAIDVEPPALEIISHFCSKSGLFLLERTFTDPAEGLRYLKKFPTDLLFLDGNMPGLSIIQFLKRLEFKPLVINTTGYSQYAVESYNLDAVNYLLKPFSEERFTRAIIKARVLHQMNVNAPNQQGYCFVRADYRLVKINIKDIKYIEGLDDYLKIHLENSPAVVTRMTLKFILDKLPASGFMRIHRSFIIALDKISSIRNKHVRIGTTEIPLGSTYEEEFLRITGGRNIDRSRE